MHHLVIAVLSAAVSTTAAYAAEPLTAEEFDALTQGRTLFFYSQGDAYGAERYKPGRRVTWTFLDGECSEGEWYQQGRFICFVYDTTPAPQCWTFYADGAGIRALFEDRAGATEIYEAGESDEDLLCLGPKIGV